MSIIINLYGGPGCGKTSLGHELMAVLKWRQYHVEFAIEAAKDYAWEDRPINQVVLFGQQYERIIRPMGQVDIVITDSPLLLNAAYSQNMDLNKFILEESNKFTNLNFFVERVKEYDPVGRYQTESQARELDDKIKSLLQKCEVPYYTVRGEEGESMNILKIYEGSFGSNANFDNSKSYTGSLRSV